MSERMTDEQCAEAVNLAQQWWTPEHVGVRLAREVVRARRVEQEQAEVIRNLASVLESHARQIACPNCGGIGSRTCATCDHGDRPTHHPEVVAVLRLAGRLP